MFEKLKKLGKGAGDQRYGTDPACTHPSDGDCYSYTNEYEQAKEETKTEYSVSINDVYEQFQKFKAETDYKFDLVIQAGEEQALGSIAHIGGTRIISEKLAKVKRMVEEGERSLTTNLAIQQVVKFRLDILESAIDDILDRLDELESGPEDAPNAGGNSGASEGAIVDPAEGPSQTGYSTVSGASGASEADGSKTHSGLGTSDDDSGVLIDIIQGRDDWPADDWKPTADNFRGSVQSRSTPCDSNERGFRDASGFKIKGFDPCDRDYGGYAAIDPEWNDPCA